MPSITVALHEAIELSLDGDIGLKAYPIFDEAYRPILNQKIIDHYFNQEIGMETISMFRLAVKRRLNEVMPMYNQMYESQKLVIDPLNTVDLSTLSNTEGEQATKNTGESDNLSNTEASGRSINQSFPQTALANNADYAESGVDSSNRAAASAKATEASEGETTTKDQATSSTKGWQGSQAILLMQYRATFLNIDLEVIESLADCFMGVWFTGDSFTQSNRRGYGF